VRQLLRSFPLSIMYRSQLILAPTLSSIIAPY
jgi:hypothetical protein